MEGGGKVGGGGRGGGGRGREGGGMRGSRIGWWEMPIKWTNEIISQYCAVAYSRGCITPRMA